MEFMDSFDAFLLNKTSQSILYQPPNSNTHISNNPGQQPQRAVSANILNDNNNNNNHNIINDQKKQMNELRPQSAVPISKAPQIKIKISSPVISPTGTQEIKNDNTENESKKYNLDGVIDEV